MIEKEIEKQILDYLSLLPECFVWKCNNFGTYGKFRKAKSKHIINGVSDILGIYKGRFLAIEVKTKTGKTSTEQDQFLENIRIQGGISFVARSLEEVKEYLE